MRIAVIDDDSSVRNALRRLLISFNFSADTFASGHDFLASKDQVLDCIVLDLKMPGIDGLELLRLLATRPIKIPLIIVSACDTPKSRMDCESSGAFAFVPKPFDDVALFCAIRSAVALEHSEPTVTTQRATDAPNRN